MATLTELPARGDEDGLGAERVPQEAAGGGAREGRGNAARPPAAEQPHLQLTVPPPPEKQLLLNEQHVINEMYLESIKFGRTISSETDTKRVHP